MSALFNLYKNAFTGLSKSIWLLSLITLINRSGTMVIPFLSVYLTQELTFSKGQTGLLITMFGIGSLIGSYIGGLLTDRIGYYKVLFSSLFFGGLLFIGLDFIHDFYGLLFYILVLSTVAEAYRPAVMVAVSIYSKPENTTRSFGLLRFAINLGFSLGPALGGILALKMGYSWLFWVDGITCMGAGLLFLFTLREKNIPKETIEEELVLPPDSPAPSVYRDRKYLFFLVTCVLSGIVFVQFNSVIPVFFKEEILMSEASIGLLLATNGIMITLFEMPLVYKLEHNLSLLRIIIYGYLLMGLCYFVFLFFPPIFATALVAIIFLTLGEMMCFPFSNTYAIQQATPATRGRYMALYTISWSIAHISAPLLGFQIVAYLGYNYLWIFLIFLSLFATWGVWYLEGLKGKELSTDELSME